MNTKSTRNEAGELAALRDFFAYNTFVRKKYLRLICKLPEKTAKKDRGASYPSILDIFTHALDVIRSWPHAYETGEDLPELKGLSLEELRKEENRVDAYVETFMRKLKPEDLGKSFSFTPGNGKRILTLNTGEMLWHCVEEELQHRGELNALLWQDDIDPPVTDWFSWKEAARKKTK